MPPSPLRLLYVADGRSPTALNWIHHFVKSGHEVHLVSTYPCSPDIGLASLTILPVAFGRLAGEQAPAPAANPSGKAARQSQARGVVRKMVPVSMRTGLRQLLGPLTLRPAARRLAALIERVKPDLVHAMRVPYEGMLAAAARPSVPLLVSIWGNDFTLHAPSNPWMSRLTRLTMQRADALHTDCYRDSQLAHQWGFPPDRPVVVLPGSGGIQLDLFYPPADARSHSRPVIINPRGFRAYVRNDTFFHAIPRVLAGQPQARFLCPNMAAESQAVKWVEELGISNAVQLLPRQKRSDMADLFRKADLVVSITTHDGTPNTLLEAMACGCFPIAGDIESIREWIEHGQNGLLVDPSDPQALAGAILQALSQPEQLQRAAAHNRQMMAERAEYHSVMAQAEHFYQSLRM